MKNQIFMTFLLSLVLSQTVVHANAVQNNKNLIANNNKPSLIEKAIWQQKNQRSEKPGIDLNVLNDLQMTTPTQSFFAAQNQRFSRFVQALFNNTNS